MARLTDEVKTAPVKMYHFIGEQLRELDLHGSVASIEVEDEAYRVTLALADRTKGVLQLSAYDISRSMRGHPDALAVVRSQLRESVLMAATVRAS